ncbi:hypothetical protein HK405_013045, partial [Cladochytrium tenue]
MDFNIVPSPCLQEPAPAASTHPDVAAAPLFPAPSRLPAPVAQTAPALHLPPAARPAAFPSVVSASVAAVAAAQQPLLFASPAPRPPPAPETSVAAAGAHPLQQPKHAPGTADDAKSPFWNRVFPWSSVANLTDVADSELAPQATAADGSSASSRTLGSSNSTWNSQLIPPAHDIALDKYPIATTAAGVRRLKPSAGLPPGPSAAGSPKREPLRMRSDPSPAPATNTPTRSVASSAATLVAAARRPLPQSPSARLVARRAAAAAAAVTPLLYTNPTAAEAAFAAQDLTAFGLSPPRQSPAHVDPSPPASPPPRGFSDPSGLLLPLPLTPLGDSARLSPFDVALDELEGFQTLLETSPPRHMPTAPVGPAAAAVVGEGDATVDGTKGGFNGVSSLAFVNLADRPVVATARLAALAADSAVSLIAFDPACALPPLVTSGPDLLGDHASVAAAQEVATAAAAIVTTSAAGSSVPSPSLSDLMDGPESVASPTRAIEAAPVAAAAAAAAAPLLLASLPHSTSASSIASVDAEAAENASLDDLAAFEPAAKDV